MAVSTSCSASLKVAGQTIAKVRDIQFTVARDALETTGIGECDRTYVYGVRGSTGTGTLLYDPAATSTAATMNLILADTPDLTTVELDFDTESVGTGAVSGPALITQMGVGVSVGDLVAVPISFTMSGKPTGTF